MESLDAFSAPSLLAAIGLDHDRQFTLHVRPSAAASLVMRADQTLLEAVLFNAAENACAGLASIPRALGCLLRPRLSASRVRYL